MLEDQGFVLGPDGTKLFVQSRAHGYPDTATRAIFCDGILCDGFIWKYMWDTLAPAMPVTHWHYRGHGRSALPQDPERIGISAHAADLQAVRESLGHPPVVLFGHSMGCQVVLEAYRRYPERVKGLVLVCGSFGRLTANFHGFPVLDIVLPTLLRMVGKAPNLVRALWSRIPLETTLNVALKSGEVDANHLNPDDLRPYLHHMTHVDLGMFFRMLRAAGEHSAWDVLPEVDIPTLIIAGEKDTFTPAYLAEEMARRIPGADMMMIDGGSHVASIEHPQRVGERVTRFLRERVLP